MPDRKRDGKGRFAAEQDPEQEKKEAFLSKAHERFKRAEIASAPWRKDALDDFEFYIGNQWPDDIKLKRTFTMTVNRLKQFKRLITNEQRQQRPAIQINPVSGGATVDSAQDMQGLVRHVEVDSEAETIYDNGFDHMVIGGKGWIHVLTEYCKGQFYQDIKLKGVRNPFMVYEDPDYVEPDGCDMKWLFIIADIPKEQYKEDYPDSEAASLDEYSSIGDNARDWMAEDTIRVAGYYYREDVDSTIYQHQDGGDVLTELPQGANEKDYRKRTEKRPKVMWAKITALDILEQREVVFDSIPMVPILGEELDINGKRYLAGMVRDAKDPQREFNYMESACVEAIALAPKAPFIAYEEVIAGHEKEWEQANRTTYSVLQGKAVFKQNTLLPLPQREQAEPPIQALVAMRGSASMNLQAVTGLNDASLGERRPDEAAKSTLARQKQGDVSNLHYADNLARSIRRVGRLIVRAVPRVYDVPRILRIVKPDQTYDMVAVHSGQDQQQQAAALQQQNKSIKKLLDVSLGEYDVTVSVGPSYQTKRQEAVASIMALIQAAPQVLGIVGDLLVGNMDWNNAQEIARRLKKTLPPGVADDDAQDPESRANAAEAKLKAIMQQHDAIVQALNKANEIINTKQVENDAKIAVAKLDQATKIAVAEITTKAQDAQMRAEITLEVYKEVTGQSLDLRKQQMDQAHQAATQASDQAHASATQASDQAHATATQASDQEHATATQESDQQAAAAASEGQDQ